jgi:hypothetical protein
VSDLQGFLDESEDILTNWAGSADAASWSADGSHEGVDPRLAERDRRWGRMSDEDVQRVRALLPRRAPAAGDRLAIGGPAHGQAIEVRPGTEAVQVPRVEVEGAGVGPRDEDVAIVRHHLYVRRLFAFPPEQAMEVLVYDGLDDMEAQRLLYGWLLAGQPGVRTR